MWLRLDQPDDRHRRSRYDCLKLAGAPFPGSTQPNRAQMLVCLGDHRPPARVAGTLIIAASSLQNCAHKGYRSTMNERLPLVGGSSALRARLRASNDHRHSAALEHRLRDRPLTTNFGAPPNPDGNAPIVPPLPATRIVLVAIII